MRLLIAIILSYLVGSIPTGLLIGRWLRGIDLREHGSGNLGATNAFRVLGKKVGVTVLFLDVLKGLAPVVLLPELLGMRATAGQEMAIGAAAILGHIYSIWVGFRGGKGVATSLGVFLAIATGETIILLIIGAVVIASTGYVSVATLIGAVLLPILLYAFGRATIVLFVGEIIALLVIWKHRPNIRRLFEGRELKFNEVHEDDEPIPPAGSEHPNA